MVELQHYEANAASGSLTLDSLDRPSTAMPTNTRLQVAVTTDLDEVRKKFAVIDGLSYTRGRNFAFVSRSKILLDSAMSNAQHQ